MPDVFEVRFYSSDGTQRRSFPRRHMTTVTSNLERYGLYADFTVNTAVSFRTDALPQILLGDRCEFWYAGVLRYRGYVFGRNPSKEEPDTLVFSGYGASYFARRQICMGNYAYPGNGSDLSLAFADVSRDDILPQAGFGGVPVLDSVTTAPIGTLTQSLNARKKLSGSVLDDIVTQSGNLAVWGVDVDPAGRNRLFFRPIDPIEGTGAFARHTIGVPSAKVAKASAERQVSDVVTRLLVTGGQPRYPQLLANPDFELPITSAESSEYLLNPDFEKVTGGTSVDGWTMGAGASPKQTDYSGNYKGEPYSGSWQIELDHVGEYASQSSTGGFTPGHTLTLGAWLRNQYAANACTGTGTLELSDVSSAVLLTRAFPLAPTGTDWQWFSTSVQIPAGATNFRVRFQCDAITLVGSSGGLMLDAVQFYDASVVYQDNWQAALHDGGGGTAEFQAVDWTYRDSVHSGRYAAYLKMHSNDADGQDCHLEPLNQASFQVKGNQSVRFGFWYRSPVHPTPGASLPKMFVQISFRASDGHETNKPGLTLAAAAVSGTWQYAEIVGTAHGDSTSAVVWVVFRSDGEIVIDEVSARDASARAAEGGGLVPGDGLYVPDSTLDILVDASDAALGLDATRAMAASLYGTRADILSESDLTVYADLVSAAGASLRNTTLDARRPTIDIVEDATVYLPGDSLRLLGQDGAALSGRIESIAHVSLSFSGDLFTASLQAEEEPRDVLLIVKKLILQEQQAQGTGKSQGSNNATSPGNGKGGGGGITSPTYRATLQASDSDPTLHDAYDGVPHASAADQAKWTATSAEVVAARVRTVLGTTSASLEARLNLMEGDLSGLGGDVTTLEGEIAGAADMTIVSVLPVAATIAEGQLYLLESTTGAGFKPAGTPTYIPGPVQSALLLDLLMNEGAGSAATDYKNGNVFTGAPSWGTDASASSPFIAGNVGCTPSYLNASAWTWVALCLPTTASLSAGYHCLMNVNSGFDALYLHSGVPVFYNGGTDTPYTGLTPVAGQPLMVAGAYDGAGTTSVIAFNASNPLSAWQTRAVVTTNSSGYGMTVGTDIFGQPFLGDIYFLRLFNRVLTSAELAAMFANPYAFYAAGAADSLYVRGKDGAGAATWLDLTNADIVLGSAASHAATDFDAAGSATAAATAVLSTSLQKASNLSDVASATTARGNLGLGSAAVQNTSAFDSAGAAASVLGTSLQKASNLSDVASAGASRTNLGAQSFISFNVRDYAAKGNLATAATGAITSGSALLSAGTAFTAGDVGKGVLVLGAGVPYNNRGAYVAATAYAMGDLVTWSGLTFTPFLAATDPYFTPTHWYTITATVRALEATILSVAGGVATLSVNATTTVSGATFWYGSDDSAAFTSAILAANAAGGGSVYVPGGSYCLQSVSVVSGVQLVLGSGVVLRKTPGSTSRTVLIVRGAGSIGLGCAIIGDYWTIDCTGYDPVTSAGTPAPNGITGVYVDYAQDWRVEGFTLLNGNGGNAVQITPATGNINPVRGTVKRIKSIGGSFGWGAVQVDGCSGLYVESVWSDMGAALNIETDDSNSGSGPNIGRVAENITAVNIRLEARSTALSFYALNIVAHSETIRDVLVSSVRASGGAGGVGIGYDYPLGYIDHISIKKLHVSGGGPGVYIPSNQAFKDFVIEDFYVEGVSLINPSTTAPYPACQFTAGMTYKNGSIVNCAGDGFYASFWAGTGSINAYSAGVARLIGCEAHACGTSGTAYYGLNNRYCQAIELMQCSFSDSPVSEMTPVTIRDCQVITVTPRWVVANTSCTLSRDTTTAWKAGLLLTSNAAQVYVESTTATGTGGMPVTAGTWYRVHGWGKAVGYLAEAAVAVAANAVQLSLGLWWYNAAGTFLSSSFNSQGNAYMTKGAFAYQSNMAQAPAGAAFATIVIQPTRAATMTSGEAYLFIPGGFGPVTSTLAGTQQQAYGMYLGQGLFASIVDSSVQGYSGRITGPGLYTEVSPRDPTGIQPVAWGVQAHFSDGVQTITRNTTSLTSAQIDALFSLAPVDGTMIADPVNNIALTRLAGKWYKTAALTLIP